MILGKRKEENEKKWINYDLKLMSALMSFAVILILFVLFRMKSVEQGLRYGEIEKEIKIYLTKNKELKAKKAELLSVGNLNKLANKFLLKRPKEEQIIIVP